MHIRGTLNALPGADSFHVRWLAKWLITRKEAHEDHFHGVCNTRISFQFP